MLILWSHALAALLFGALAMSQVSVPHRRAFAAALAITALWALAMAGMNAGEVGAGVMEAARDVAWLVAMLLFVRQLAGLGFGLGAVYAAVGGIACLAAILGVIEAMPAAAPVAEALASVRALFRMLAAAGALVLVNHAQAACLAGGRGRARIVVVALAVAWGSDLLVFGARYADLSGSDATDAVRGVAALAVALLIAMAGQREDDRQVAVSRIVAVRSLSAAALAGYAGFVAILSSIAAAVGGGHARLIQTGIVIGATVALLTLLSTPWLRAWAKVKVAKHLFSHRYDYRVEWRRFTDTLGHPATGPLTVRIVKAIADLTDSPAGLLLVADGGRLAAGAAWNWDEGEDGGEDGGPELAEHLSTTGRIVELDAVRAGSGADDPVVPAWLTDRGDAWTIVPLVHGGVLAGAVVLARPLIDRALDWEDLDLLRLAGTQAASALAEDRAHDALAEAQRFDEFSRRFAFLIHDIKNVASQLALVARNAERHAANPDFRADMVATLKDSSDRMTTLLARLAPQEHARPEPLGPVAVGALVARIARARRAQHPVMAEAAAPGPLAVAHAARLEQVICHLVQNAVEASAPAAPVTLSALVRGDRVMIAVADRGCGMTPAFVRDELFRPFASTKADGFGIGAFEARQLVSAMGGTLEVTSREGEGTCFRILLPRALAPEQVAA